MKTIAVITPSYRDFRMYELQQMQTEKETKFIHIQSLNSCYGVTINDHVSITNSAKMSNLNQIQEQLNLRKRNWIKIESDNDLPKSNCIVLDLLDNGQTQEQKYYTEYKDFSVHPKKYITHYQIIP